MPYPIDRKLVVGISSNALFDLEDEDRIFKNKGLTAYKEHQIEKRDSILDKGLAFPFIKRYLNINKVYKEEEPVEVVLISKNSPETGVRIFNSIKEYGLDISRAAFTSGESPYEYIPPYNISLFLSTSENDVLNAINAGYPAGRIIKSNVLDVEEEKDLELRVAFDFDGVLIDDEAEKVYKETEQLSMFHQYETKKLETPHNPGLMADFFKKLSFFQKLESKKQEENSSYKKILKTAIVTARNAPSHGRAINTLEHWGVSVDKMFFLGGIEKKRVLETLKPHLFIDDQLSHLDDTLENITLVHLPFGVANAESKSSLPKATNKN
ncbi:5'-nucleotidase [Rhodohalobacter sulfatireducens]|uniref:5'-nucleotidase n=1 Tax=Rhodohalobacter sulfatireducens TaxID=2911366 RepID=A0ABS9KA93_9BACT|nr:5'-nucleotidase [Rhodohalobacter sulfatireducens]MCG2587764.1 5'-nucleotidase [Rhodohalobacter sulfatireducens]